MTTLKFAPEVQLGSTFSRIDKNGKRWWAEVIHRTPYFIKVMIHNPYNDSESEEGRIIIREDQELLYECTGKKGLLGVPIRNVIIKVNGYFIELHDRKKPNYTSNYTLDGEITPYQYYYIKHKD